MGHLPIQTAVPQPAPTMAFDDDALLEADAVNMEITADQNEAGVMDEGKTAHNEATVNSVKGQTIELAKEMGIWMTPHEEKIALGLFPTHAKLVVPYIRVFAIVCI